MDHKHVGKGVRKLLLYLVWPWPAIRRNLARETSRHKENIVYIKDLAHRPQPTAPDDREDDPARGQTFEEAMRGRGPGALPAAQLEKRFVRQKRLALATCAAFVVMAGTSIANGNWLGIATLLTCLPLFFMACLSAQLRLWQLRTKRLSKEEKGGLGDFFRETDGWLWQVLDPEIGNKTGEPK